jgi:hypothetical protein
MDEYIASILEYLKDYDHVIEGIRDKLYYNIFRGYDKYFHIECVEIDYLSRHRLISYKPNSLDFKTIYVWTLRLDVKTNNLPQQLVKNLITFDRNDCTSQTNNLIIKMVDEQYALRDEIEKRDKLIMELILISNLYKSQIQTEKEQ